MSDLILTEQNPFNSALNSRLHDSIDYFLIEISGKIQLTPTQREKAVAHYEAIANVLRNGPETSLLNRLDIKMIPFGGLGSNTASKPFKGDEFDLDVIVRFLTTISTFKSAEKLYYEVVKILKANDIYADKIELMDRCIRIYYSGEFHLDLMPAALYLPSEKDSTKLYIPERQEDGSFRFELVDPIGLMNWFETRCKLQERFLVKNLSERGDFEVMPVTTEDARKSVLKQAAQLVKRARDVYFFKDDDCKKILKSVVVLTVAGLVYKGETNLYKIVQSILDKIDELTLSSLFMNLENPVNENENFLESLSNHSDRYEKLREFLTDFKSAWASLIQPNKDLNFRAKLLSKLFGETVANTVLAEYGERMDSINRNGNMKMMGSGLIGVSGASQLQKVPRHQFFGDK
jgi:hypothetical protein